MQTRADAINALRSRPRVPVTIIGGGINGAGVFRDLSLQGIDCLIIDKADFCAGASAAPSRLIHGGVKYLETGEFRLVAQSTLERNLLLRNAPHFVKPLRTVLPIYSYFGGSWASLLRFLGLRAPIKDRGALVVELGLALYDYLGRRHRVMPRHSLSFRRRSFERFPGINPRIKATATYFDARISQPERLNFELIADALDANPGSVALNYAAVSRRDGRRLIIRDLESETALPVETDLIVNAAGAWIDSVNAMLGLQRRYIGGTKGSHLIIDKPRLRDELDGRMVYFGSVDGRICLVYPFMGHLLLGSTDLRADDPDRVRCEDDEIAYLLNVLREVFPGAGVKADDVVYRYSGVRPLPFSEAGDTGEISRDHSIKVDESPDGGPPVLSLVGGKWTTFRGFSEEAADEILKRLGRDRRVHTRTLAIGGGKDFPTADAERAAWLAGLESAYALAPRRSEILLERYGTRARDIAAYCAAGGDRPLSAAASLTERELQYLCRHEMVVHLPDLLFRRTPVALSGSLTSALIGEAAALAAGVLDWNGERQRLEREMTEALARKHGVRLDFKTFGPVPTADA